MLLMSLIAFTFPALEELAIMCLSRAAVVIVNRGTIEVAFGSLSGSQNKRVRS